VYDSSCAAADLERELQIDPPVGALRGAAAFVFCFDLRVADVGVIVTRCDELQEVFNALGKGASYGPTTTILSKLQRKLDGGAGGGCPVLAIGMKKTLYVDDVVNPQLAEKFVRIERKAKGAKPALG
jgi:hypothetical protein